MPSPETNIEQRGLFGVTGRVITHDAFGMQLIHDSVIRPDGTSGDVFWVNFKTDPVLVFILDNEGSLYMSDKYCYAVNEQLLEVPGGAVRENETFEQAVSREAKQELGAEVEIDSLGYLGTVSAITGRVRNPTHLFVAKINSLGFPGPEIGENVSLQKIPFSRAVEMAEQGDITTQSVIVGILRLNAFFRGLDEFFAVQRSWFKKQDTESSSG